ncbi:hypothetical protein TWF730_003804 [Orbilia blumenaviensis]|uniref:Uncharacterized protein n=1 Tax=Orbilia blumenaviensis TaxID=1796055 RepID=A0AAV9U368_9PEZI
MPLRCPAGATRAAPFISYTSPLTSRRVPLRICSSCRARLSLRGLSTQSDRRRPLSLRYQLLADNLPSRSQKYGFLYPTTSVAHYATNASDTRLPRRGNESLSPKLVILGTPSQRRSVDPLALDPVNKDQLDGLTRALQTFEFKVEEAEVSNEILLFKPESLRVSKLRFEQVLKDLDTAFLGPQVKDYLSTTELDIAGGISKLRKAQALNLVMRQVWGVQIDEEIAAEMDVIREKELKFQKMHLFFMMMEGGDMLQKLASRNRTRIILNSATSTVVLKGTKARIERVEHQLRDLPTRIVDSGVNISALLRVGKVTETYIPSISRLTSVFLEITDDELTLHGILPYGPRNILDAKRLLFNSTDLHLRQMYSLLGETKLTAPLTGALYPVAEDQTLPWMYRGREWCRWRSIRTPKSNTSEPIEDDLSLTASAPLLNPARGDKVTYSDIRSLLDSFSTSSSISPDPTPEASIGNTNTAVADQPETHITPNSHIPPGAEIQTSYRAVLGQILHSSPTLPQTREPKSLSDLFASNPSHVLCNSVPKVLDFLSTLNPVTYKYDFKILLKFSPSPWMHPKNFELLPPVELELQVKPDTNELLAMKVAAVESHSIVDVLMPRNACDLRFVKRTLARVEGKTRKVKDYIRAAKLDVLGEDRLEAGEVLEFNLPKWMVKEAEKVEKLQREPEEELDYDGITFSTPGEEDPLGVVPVHYFFTGLETRSSTAFDFDGSALVYTKVEAGASGGSYDEVVLECSKQEIEYLTPLEQQTLGREDEIAEQKKVEENVQQIKDFETLERERIEQDMINRGQYARDIMDPVFSTADPEEVKKAKLLEKKERKAREKAERLESERLEAETKGQADGAVEAESGEEASLVGDGVGEAVSPVEAESGDEVDLVGTEGVTELGTTTEVEATAESEVRPELEETVELKEAIELEGTVEPEEAVESDEIVKSDEIVESEEVVEPEAATESTSALDLGPSASKSLQSDLDTLDRELSRFEETAEDAEISKQPTGLEFLYGEETEPEQVEVRNEEPAEQALEPAFDESKEDEEEESDVITDIVFHRFVQTARKLVEAVEHTESDHERVKPKRL